MDLAQEKTQEQRRQKRSDLLQFEKIYLCPVINAHKVSYKSDVLRQTDQLVQHLCGSLKSSLQEEEGIL